MTKIYQSLYRMGYLSIFAGSSFMSSALAESLQVTLTDGQTQEIKLAKTVKIKRGDLDRSKIDLQTISTVTIPSSVKSIGKNTFSNCSALQSVTFAEKSQLTKIAQEAFFMCGKLRSITIPAKVEDIGEDAFSLCASLSSVNFEADCQLTKIGNCAFCMCGNLKSINIPAKVRTIGENAFFYCSSLTSVTFAEGDQLETIGIAAFRNCKKLKQVTIPVSVIEILEDAFSGCTALSSITLDKNSRLRFIGTMAFSECRRLKKITLPSEMEYIGSLAFAGCSSLRDVTFDENCNIMDQNFPKDIFWESRVSIIRASRAMEGIFGRIWTPSTCHVYYYNKAVSSETKDIDVATKAQQESSIAQ